MGEYANSKQDILDVTEEIKKGLGDVRSPFFLNHLHVHLWCISVVRNLLSNCQRLVMARMMPSKN